MILNKIMKRCLFLLLILLTIIGLFLRIYRLGFNNFREDEYYSFNAASYLYFCQESQINCKKEQNPALNSFKSKLEAFLLNNETKPNLLAEIYLWDWVKKAPSSLHYSRSWPHLVLTSISFKTFGISEFSSRLPSAIFGTILIPIAFLWGFYFSQSKKLALLFSAILTFSPDYIYLSRHCRMYSVYFVLFLITVYFVYKAINSQYNRLLYVFLAIISFSLSYWLHLLTLIFALAFFIYNFFQAIFRKQKKYILATIVLLFILAILFYFSKIFKIDIFHSYFLGIPESPNWYYLKFFFSSPLPTIFTLPIILINFPYLFSKNKTRYLIFIIFSTFIFLFFLTEFPPGGIYFMHILPIVLMLFLLSLDKLLKYKKLSNYKNIVIVIIVGYLIYNFLGNVRYIYLGRDDKPKPSEAYKVILANITPNDSLIGIQIRDYYLQKLPKTTNIINLPEKKLLSLNSFIQIINQHPQGWIIWEEEKVVHLKKEIVNYIKQNFIKVAGKGIDNNRVEIYYFPKKHSSQNSNITRRQILRA